MVADMAANMEVHMVADMEVDKVANMVTDMVTNKKRSWCMHENKVGVCMKTKLMYKKCIESKLFDARGTWLECLLSFASLFLTLRI